ncbi:MAG: DUF2520 domain-containing protein [Marinilabiliales bacterium]
MKVVLIGYGNLGFHIAKAVDSCKHDLIQVFSKSQSEKSIQYNFTNDIKLLRKDADLYIISVADEFINDVAAKMPTVDGVVVHTSGSTNINELSRFKHFGVFYPLQTFTKNYNIDFSKVPVLLEASDNKVKKTLENFSKQIAGKIYYLSSEQRLYVHIAAVFACNFTNFMNVIAQDLLTKKNIEKEILNELIQQTFEKLGTLPAYKAQTGPAIRGDIKTIKKHLEALSVYPEVQKVYDEISNIAYNYFHKK